ncbi:MAG: anthranilate phosphoribosyltransferase [Myxococcota bacterium]|jgi:anthranilate phosphoribosyltransferase
MSDALKPFIAKLVAGQDLTQAEAEQSLDTIMAGEATDAQIAAWLTALRMKGETVAEIAGAVRAMRARVVPIPLDHPVILDTCGTGGDGAGTFNISTAVAFVCAAAGVVVAKHGNRAISSSVGSADVLEALGLRIDLNAHQVKHCIDTLGIGFMFAPTHHSALRHAAPARRQLGFRTILNLLGPMTNPANATHQLIGLFDRTRLATVARVLDGLGSRRALVVHGDDGLDELTITGPTHAVALDQGSITEHTLDPGDYGVERSPITTVAGGDAAYNAGIVRRVLSGETGPPADIVRLNAGAALWAAERAPSIGEGVAQATQILASGQAWKTLASLAALTQALGASDGTST